MAVGEPVYRINTTSNVVYLTFDDGPYGNSDLAGAKPRANATTVALLEKLDQLRQTVNDPELSATFFLNGWGLERDTPTAPFNPAGTIPQDRLAIARSILTQGHDIANHSYLHKNPWGKMEGVDGTPTVVGMLEETTKTQKALHRINSADKVGRVQPYLRAPGDPSYYPIGDEKTKSFKNVSAMRIWNGGPVVPEPAKARLRKILQVSTTLGLTYVTYNIWAKDERLSVSADFVYWQVINVQQSQGNKDPDKLRCGMQVMGKGVILG